ncbi:MAG: hypothetical protein WAW39_28935 [Prosthecobacter sp.]|uniref:hypothetical protein n=1 Tax=Prosthecobacter sp. TaxID=1965333 RepID=UPI003BAE2851
MLSPLTILALQRFTCVLCEQPLLNAHTYPLIEPGQLLSQTTDIGPHHPSCAQKHLENLLLQDPNTQTNFRYIAGLYTVQTSTTSPSGRIIRLHEEDADSTVIHLFSPLTVNLICTVAHPARPMPARLGGRAKTQRRRYNLVTRAADYAEIEEWMSPALQDAANNSRTEAEKSDLVQQIARLHKHFPKRTTPGIQEPASPTSES